MNRKEYLEELARQLDFLPEDTKAAALSFYGEMLDDRMEDGMDEASAAAAMESPAAIAARLRAENPAEEEAAKEENNAEKENQPGQGDGAWEEATEKTWEKETEKTFDPLDRDAFHFSTLVDDVMKKVSRAMEDADISKEVNEAVQGAREAFQEAQSTAQQAWDEAKKAQSAAQQAWDEAKKARVEWEEGEEPPETVGEYQRKTFTCPVSALRAVQLTASDKPIRIKPCPGPDATLIYYTCERDPYTVEMENGVLKLSNLEKGRGRGGFSFLSIGFNIRLSWNKGSPKVYLLLPPDALVDLTVKTSNGSIRAQDLSALCRVDLATSNSRIDLKRVCCKSLELKTSNGRLSLEQVESKQGFFGATSNSRIEGTHLICGQEMQLKTSNGRIEAHQARARGDMRLVTSNGAVNVSGLEAAALEMRTSNGSIRGTLPGRQADWDIESGTSNGRNSLPTRQKGGKRLFAHTSNGNIDVTFEG